MKLGRVIGSVVATRKDPSLEGTKLLVVENLTLDLEPEGGYVVAVDAVIMAIVDSFDAQGKNVRLA